MKKVNGTIVEATEDELKQLWEESNWHKTLSYKSFKQLMIDYGCTMKEVECLKETITSVESVLENTGRFKSIVSGSEITIPKTVDIVKDVKDETIVMMPAMTEPVQKTKKPPMIMIKK